MPSPQQYRDVCTALWPNYPVADLFDYFDRYNAALFAGLVPMRGLTVEQLPYGACIGQTRGKSHVLAFARNLMGNGPAEEVAAVVLHEMLHSYLFALGENPAHNGTPWSREVERITAHLGGPDVVASPVVRKRRPKSEGGGLYYDHAKPGSLPRKALATWPQSLAQTGAWWMPPAKTTERKPT